MKKWVQHFKNLDEFQKFALPYVDEAYQERFENQICIEQQNTKKYIRRSRTFGGVLIIVALALLTWGGDKKSEPMTKAANRKLLML